MKNIEESKWIRFLGGKNTIFTLILIILTAIAIFLLNSISYIFKPLVVIFFTILPPGIFALVLYYLLNPIVTFLQKKKIPRTWGVGLIYLVILVLFILAGMQLIPMLQQQTVDLISQLPSLIDDFQNGMKDILDKTPLASQFDRSTKFCSHVFCWSKCFWSNCLCDCRWITFGIL